MNKGHQRYFRMFGNVQSVMDNNSTTWSTIPIVSTLKNELDEVIQRIDHIYGNNTDHSKSITRKKEKLRELLAIKVPIVTNALYAFGELTNDELLKEYHHINKSSINSGREFDIVANVNAVISICKDRQDGLVGFGISEALITEIETTLDDFKHLIGEARNIRNSIYSNIQEADQLIDAGNQLLRNKVDKVMKVFELTRPNFYDLYTRARVLVN